MRGTILITGVSGFIGSHAAAAARATGWRTLGLDMVAPPERTRALLDSFHTARLGEDALTNWLAVSPPDYCFHCAGVASVPQSFAAPAEDFESGPRATFHLLEQLRRHAPQCRTVFLSSAAVYGNPERLPVDENQSIAPLSPYGWHKWLSEQVCRQAAQLFQTRVAVARIFSAYGPGLRKQVVWDLCEKFAAGGPVTLQGNGAESRDFIHVSDIIAGLFTIAEKGDMNCGLYNLSAGVETPISVLAQTVRAGLELDGQAFGFSGTLPQGTPSRWRADITKLSELGFAPSVTLTDGIASVIRWRREQQSAARCT
jgi:UDP-glucose 4-epimerase